MHAYMCAYVDSILKCCLCMGVQVFILKFRLYYLLGKYTQMENIIDINEVSDIRIKFKVEFILIKVSNPDILSLGV